MKCFLLIFTTVSIAFVAAVTVSPSSNRGDRVPLAEHYEFVPLVHEGEGPSQEKESQPENFESSSPQVSQKFNLKNIPTYSFDAPLKVKDEPEIFHPSRQSHFIFDLVNDRRRLMNRFFPSVDVNPFRPIVRYPEETRRIWEPKANDDAGFGHFFRRFFEPDFERELVSPFGAPPLGNLPPNYKNTTSDVHNINGTRIVVNQTIHKTSDDSLKHFYHHKTVHISPQEKKDGGQSEGTDTVKILEIPEQSSSSEASTIDIDDSLNEIIQSNAKIRNKVQEKRSVDSSTGNRAISFPHNALNRFPHSSVNNNVWSEDSKTPKDKGGISRSYVYKNMDGKPYLYIVNHNEGLKKDSSATISDAETVGPIRPPDLSGDTKVNPDGSSDKQGLTMIDPDAEVFDLSLVIKEIDSRPKP